MSAKRSSKPSTPRNPLAVTTPRAGATEQRATYVAQLLRRLTPPTADEHAAFASQCSDAEADRRGGETVAAEVVKESSAYFKSIDAPFAAHADAIECSAARVAFAAGLHAALVRAIEAQAEGQGAAGASRRHLGACEADARGARQKVVRKLRAIFRGNAEGTASLRDARLEANTPEGQQAALKSAMRIARELLANREAKWRVLCADRKLTARVVDDAARKLEALDAAIEGKSELRAQGDQPAVNRLEGQLLFQLEVIYDAFEAAREDDPVIPLPKLGPTLRRALLDRRPGKASAAPDAQEPPPGPTGGAPGATEPAPGAT